MAKLPEEGRFEYGKMDKQTGAQWVHVTPEMARNHPQGRLNLALWLIAVIFAALGVLQIGVYFTQPYLILLVGGLLRLLTALLIAIRAPWALFVAGFQLLMTVIGTVTSGLQGNLFDLAVLLFSASALFYLIEGDRSNLIFRHRFRSFSRSQSEE